MIPVSGAVQPLIALLLGGTPAGKHIALSTLPLHTHPHPYTQIVAACALLHAKLFTGATSDLLSVQRYAVPGAPRGSNRDFFRWVHTQIETEGAVPAVPFFLLLVDDVLRPPLRRCHLAASSAASTPRSPRRKWRSGPSLRAYLMKWTSPATRTRRTYSCNASAGHSAGRRLFWMRPMGPKIGRGSQATGSRRSSSQGMLNRGGDNVARTAEVPSSSLGAIETSD